MMTWVGGVTVRQIVYLSSEAMVMGDAELHNLRDEALANNSHHGVTGLLLYVNRVFMQIIEGPNAAIGQLYDNIRHDPRNQDVIEMFDRDVGDRAFPNWSMGFHSPGAANGGMDQGFHNLRTRADFAAVERQDLAVFSLMQELYVANAGRGF
ncbi:MAG: hypothetical protein GKS00_15370 [Alphaproteobacteria bacterium]|nr:hypothetical protein [Alphaproteobacteria bacterium]